MAAPLEALLETIAEAKGRLDFLRPLRGQALAAVQTAFDVELTFTSNAIEGNTLTLRETAEVIERGITVGGKPLRDHLEAVDHYEAVLWTRELATRSSPIGEAIVCELHRRIVARSQPGIAGIYSPHPRRVAGSTVIFPNPAKVPELMSQFGHWLSTAPPTPEVAFEAHFRLTAIHPFADGNGRTARLLMNLMLIRAGYPPIAIRPEDRSSYLDSLEHASLADDLAPYQTLMHARLGRTLAAYVELLESAIEPDDHG